MRAMINGMGNLDILKIQKGLDENVRLGLMKKVIRRDGEVGYKLTTKGVAFVKAMPFKDELESAEWLKNYF